MTKEIYDFIVVGAGPAGCIAAYKLAKKNFKVALIERNTLPRYKPCGGAIPSVISNWLDFPLFCEEYSLPIRQAFYSLRGKNEYYLETDKTLLWSVNRADFDFNLFKKAETSGAETFQNELVQNITEKQNSVEVITKSSKIFTGKFLLAADGANSIIAQKSNLRKNKSAFAVSGVVEIPKTNNEFSEKYSQTGRLDLNWIKNGYAGVVPKKDTISVGIYSRKKADLNFLGKRLKDFCRFLNVDASDFKPNFMFYPIYEKHEKLNTKKTLLLGDAAKLADALSGEGIKYAVQSAVIACDILEKVVLKNSTLDKYTKTIHQTIGKELLLANKMAKLVYTFPKIAYDGLKNVKEETAQVLNGQLSYSVFTERLKKKIWKTIWRKINFLK